MATLPPRCCCLLRAGDHHLAARSGRAAAAGLGWALGCDEQPGGLHAGQEVPAARAAAWRHSCGAWGGMAGTRGSTGGRGGAEVWARGQVAKQRLVLASVLGCGRQGRWQLGRCGSAALCFGWRPGEGCSSRLGGPCCRLVPSMACVPPALPLSSFPSCRIFFSRATGCLVTHLPPPLPLRRRPAALRPPC